MNAFRISIIGLAVLTAFIVGLPQRVSGDIVTVDPASVPTIAPLSIHVSESHILPDNLRKQFELEQKTGAFGYRLGEDPNPIYQKAQPFPTMEFEYREPNTWLNPGANVKSVIAYRLRWLWPPPDPTTLPPKEQVVLWHWNVPEALIESYPAWVCRYGIERYAVLCLYSPARRIWKRDPIVFYFDGSSGLLWQTELPVRATPPSSGNGKILEVREDQCVFLGLTSDGTRILAIVNPKPQPDRNLCLLFVLNNRGEILRTLLFPDRIGLGDTTSGEGIRRSASGNRFLLRVDHVIQLNSEEGKGPYRREGETYLVDGDGNLLGRFVDEIGHPVVVSHLGDQYAAGEQPADGKHRHLIYRLPEPPAR
jgi:hypothetical protein